MKNFVPGVILILILLLFSSCDWSGAWLVSKSAEYAPSDKNSIIIANDTEPETLDPQKASGMPEGRILHELFEGLVQFDDTGKIIPGAALSWESKDNQTWIFHLRENARWSNGAPVTAGDFVYAWRRLVDPKTASTYASYLSDVYVENAAAIIVGEKPPATLGVKALDDTTLEVTLERPVPFFPDTLDHASVYPVYAPNIRRYGDKWTHAGNLVGNGPYQLKNWYVNNRIILVKNPYYWDNANTHIERAEFLPVMAVSDFINYAAGAEDMTTNTLPQELFRKLKRDYPEELKITPLACNSYYEMNLGHAPFQDKRVRLALNLLLDRKTITDDVLQTGEIPAYSLVPSFIHLATPTKPGWASWTMAKRKKTALKLLRAAGYGEKHPLKFEMLTNTGPKNKTIALAMISQWHEAAPFIRVTLVNKEWKSFLASMAAGDFDMVRRGWCADFNNPGTFLNLYKTKNSNNYIAYSNPQFDRVLEDSFKQQITEAEMKKIYARANEILLADSVDVVLFYAVGIRLIKPYVEGYRKNDPFDRIGAKNLRLKYKP